MKSLVVFLFIFSCSILIFLSGCDIVSQPEPPAKVSTGRDLVINEVFSISPDKYYAYSWVELYNPTPHGIPLVDVSNPSIGFGGGTNGTLLSTLSNGASWDPVTASIPPTANFNMVASQVSDTVYAVGDGGVIQKFQYDSTAKNYRVTTIPNPAGTVNMHDMYLAALPSHLLYVVGDNGTLMRSVRIPESFSRIALPTSNNINAIWLNPTTGSVLLCGDQGTILLGNLAGIFTVKNPPPLQATTNYHGIGMFSFTGTGVRGYAVGDNGAIAGCDSNATVWRTVTSPTKANLRRIFISPQNLDWYVKTRAWIVGDRGTILRLDDSVWHKQTSGTTANLYFVTFTDSIRGWATGDNGTILYTSDGGDHWGKQPSGTSERITGLSLTRSSFLLQQFYVLAMYAIKDSVFYNTQTYVPNKNVVLGTDTTAIQIPIITSSFVMQSHSFIVVNNDSTQMTAHSNYAPSVVTPINSSLQIDLDSVGKKLVPSFYSWKLGTSGEVRLYKIGYLTSFDPFNNVYTYVSTTASCVDVVRWGGFAATHGEFNLVRAAGVNLVFTGTISLTIFAPPFSDPNGYPQNLPLTQTIPEWSSMARYFNMVDVNPNTSNTRSSFYVTSSPLPGWPSLLGK